MNTLLKKLSSKSKSKKSPSTDNFSSQNNLDLRLEEFVTRFVFEFEAKLTSYSVILDGVIPKADGEATSTAQKVGQCLGSLLGKAAGFAVGFPELGDLGMEVMGKITKRVENKLKRAHHQCKVTKLSEFIHYFEQNKAEFRKMLIKAGLDIFQSFEMQFSRVSSDLGERGAMNQLAVDAMNRAIEYIGRTSTGETQLDNYSLILEGLKQGRSKSLQGLVGPCKGFAIWFKHEKKCERGYTGSLYSKVGMTVVENKRTEYYHSVETKHNKPLKYGYKRCFTCEDWEEMRHFYAKADLYKRKDNFLDYSYYFDKDKVMEKAEAIGLKLEADRDKDLGMDRVKILLDESKDEMLEKLKILKPMYEQLEAGSQVLSNIEARLKSLDLDEYLSKFEVKMNHILTEICKGNEETRSKLEDIQQSLGELKATVLQNINNNKQAIRENSQSSVWFEVRNELLTFTGREALLRRIETDLETGPVVISGLGGIGKSELAVKYARTRYDKADNVIWVNAETEEAMTGSIWQLAQVLGVSQKDESSQQEKKLPLIVAEIYKLIFHQKCLLIIDNAKTFSDIELLLKWNLTDDAQNPPKVIITSRNNSGWESGRFSVKVIQLEVFDQNEAIEFVKKSIPALDNNSSADIVKLIDVLGNFPLALQLAVTNIKVTHANYVKRNKTFTIDNFLEKFEQEPQKLMGGKLPLDVYRPGNSIFVVVSYTFKQMEMENALGDKAQFLLRMASYLAPDNIREDFFADEIPDEDELLEIVSLLENYSLVKINAGVLNVHRLVQQAIRLESEFREEEILRKNLRFLMKRLTTWDNITFYSPHIFSIWDYACNYGRLIDEFIIHSSTKFYIFTSFLETLIQRDKIKIVKKIINHVKDSPNCNQLNDILRKVFGEKSIYFLTNHPEMVTLLKVNVVKPHTNSSRQKSIDDAALTRALRRKFSQEIRNRPKNPIEPIALRTEVVKLTEKLPYH